MRNYLLLKISIILFLFMSGCVEESIVMNTKKTFEIKVILEGAYNKETGVMNTKLQSLLPYNQPYNITPFNHQGGETANFNNIVAVDWVLVDIADSLGSVDNYPKALLLLPSGFIVDSIGNFPYYFSESSSNLKVTIWHRNHIRIASEDYMTIDGDTYKYDFTTSENIKNGINGHKNINNIFVMIAGDCDNDNSVYLSDHILWSANAGQTNVYSSIDMDMDGSVYLSDNMLWSINSGRTSK